MKFSVFFKWLHDPKEPCKLQDVEQAIGAPSEARGAEFHRRRGEIRGEEVRLHQGVPGQADHGPKVQENAARAHVAIQEDAAQDASQQLLWKMLRKHFLILSLFRKLGLDKKTEATLRGKPLMKKLEDLENRAPCPLART